MESDLSGSEPLLLCGILVNYILHDIQNTAIDISKKIGFLHDETS